MKTLSFLVLIGLMAGGCASPGPTDQKETVTDELRSEASSFFVRAPLSSRPVERLRSTLDGAEGYAWVRNQGTLFGVEWESRRAEPLVGTALADLVQAAFAFRVQSSRRLLRDLEVVASTDEALGEALDGIGLFASTPDPKTTEVRARLLAALQDAARTRSTHVMKATLAYQPDMYWEGALVVVDEEHRQILFATGGYGT